METLLKAYDLVKIIDFDLPPGKLFPEPLLDRLQRPVWSRMNVYQDRQTRNSAGSCSGDRDPKFPARAKTNF
jgi:hypothetical protein